MHETDGVRQDAASTRNNASRGGANSTSNTALAMPTHDVDTSIASDAEDTEMHNQVVARSNIGTAFYLFNHQAGGHKPFLRSAYGEVCKPAIALELQFYQALDTRFPQLKAFVPPFVGVITVDLHPMAATMATLRGAGGHGVEIIDRDSDDQSDLVSTSADDESSKTSAGEALALQEQLDRVQLESPTCGTSPPPAVTYHGKKRRLGRVETGSGKHAVIESPTSGPTRSLISTTSYSAKLWKKERRSSGSAVAGGSGSGRGITGQIPRGNVSATREYLVLGDLTQKYSRPCVLDIKMGTRQHGEDAPPAKVKSHSAKCAATTSLSLGLRICGMQIYDEVEQRYVLRDKQWGRQLTAQDIEPALMTYLSNGSGLQRESLVTLCCKLDELQRVIVSTNGVRFWGASLLLIYEGDLRHAARREDVHLIDFAHCQISDGLMTPDDGLLLGLTNMARYLSSILDRHQRDAVVDSNGNDETRRNASPA